jgi:hypothetical protein
MDAGIVITHFNYNNYGPSKDQSIREVRVCSLGEGILLDYVHYSDPLFRGPSFIIRKGITRAGWFEIVVELLDGSFYQKTIYSNWFTNPEVNLALVVQPHNLVKRLVKPWHCACQTHNHYNLRICSGCGENSWYRSMFALSLIPFAGVPFGAAAAVLRWGVALNPSARLLPVVQRYLEAVLNSILSMTDCVFVISWASLVARELFFLMKLGTELTYKVVLDIFIHFGERTLKYEAPKLAAEFIERFAHHGHPQIKLLHRQIMEKSPLPDGFELPEDFNAHEH